MAVVVLRETTNRSVATGKRGMQTTRIIVILPPAALFLEL